MIIAIRYRLLALLLLLGFCMTDAVAQDVVVPKAQQHRQNLKDSVKLKDVADDLDSIQTALLKHINDSIAHADSLRLDSAVVTDSLKTDTVVTAIGKKNFMPDPKKALWYAIAFPGGGQIYNRKYWKLPIVYGGFLGCYYALSWNNNMYRDYSQAYIDLMDSNPNSTSYLNFLPSTYDVDSHLDRLKEIFRKKKDYYRRYRDLSFFCMLGVYALSIVDAYVDAELSSFDISPDLSLKVRPSIINDGHNYLTQHGLSGNSYGLQCSFDF